MKVKICGITNLEDALMSVEAGADMLGFNFHPGSLRYITPAACASINNCLAAMDIKVTSVGIFVNMGVKDILTVMVETGLDLVQLSGDEPAECLAALGIRAYKAVRLTAQNSFEIDKGNIREYAALRPELAPAFLVDASVKGVYGGTGVTADWEKAAMLAKQYPLLLAGGLTPENVAAAVSRVHPWGVDVASGVESSPGKKDRSKVVEFIQSVRKTMLKIDTLQK
jgi:phosphoribosylanthranilate isomerase